MNTFKSLKHNLLCVNFFLLKIEFFDFFLAQIFRHPFEICLFYPITKTKKLKKKV